MNTSFEKSKNSTDEWYTPKEIIDALGEFDLDPCAPMRPLWRTARVMYNKEQKSMCSEIPIEAISTNALLGLSTSAT